MSHYLLKVVLRYLFSSNRLLPDSQCVTAVKIGELLNVLCAATPEKGDMPCRANNRPLSHVGSKVGERYLFSSNRFLPDVQYVTAVKFAQ